MTTKNPDVIIIGAGIIGCATAFELAKKGYKTLNIDKLDQPGAGPTVNSCAIVRLSYSTYDGIALAYEGLQYWRDWENYLEVKDARGLAKFVSNGSLIMKSAEKRLAQMLALFDQVGVTYEEWDVPTLKERVPIMSPTAYYPPTRMDDERFWAESDREISGVIYVHGCGYISDPQLATHNLMVAAQNYGSEFMFNQTVSDIRQQADRVAGITLADGRQIDAPIVINVSGPHSGIINRMAGVEEEMNIKTTPLRHEVHHVPAPPGTDLDDYMGTAGDSDLGIYYRPEVGQNILVGSKDPECDPREWLDHPDEYDR
ncbi:MAG: FAD-dependent oxidoreductase, partial [Chloroflexota bacterium]